MIHCVTTMNKHYYDLIGKLMIVTWFECFPKNYKLHLYLEDFDLDIKDDRLIYEDWDDVSVLYKIWQEKNGSDSCRHQGFTKKALTQIAVWRKYSGNIFWLDADIIFFKKIPENLFETVLEDCALASWGPKYFESGTVFMNTDHLDFQKVKEIYEDIYIGDSGLPPGERWFDGELLGYSVQLSKAKFKNLANSIKSSTPLNQSWIGEYMKHYKAKRKNRENLIQALKYWNKEHLINCLNDNSEGN